MNTFVKPLWDLAEYEEIQKSLRKNKGLLSVGGCIESQKAHFSYGLSGLFPCRLLIAADEKRAREIYEDYRVYDKRVQYYPAKDLLFFQADIHGNLLIRQRMKVIQALLEQEEVTVVTSIDGCMDYLQPLSVIDRSLLRLEMGTTVDVDSFCRKLAKLGYERVAQVEACGQFSVRGGIIDLFSLTEENPFRIELWGDEIDSMRTFDVESQRSLESLEELTIYPAAECAQGKEKETFLDYFPEKQTLVILDEPGHIQERGEEVEEEFRSSRERRMEREEKNLPEQWLCAYGEVQRKLNSRNGVALYTIEQKTKGFMFSGSHELGVRSVSPYNNSFELLVKDLKNYKKQGYRVLLLSGSRTRAERLAKDLWEEGLNSVYVTDLEREVQPGELLVLYGHVKRGFEYPLIKFVVITESDIFGQEQKPRRKKQYSGQKICDFSELSIGDYVVHENHGLGIYRGIEKVEVDRIVKDYIKIEYADKSNLYILATQFDRLQKYSGADTVHAPKLNSLGGQEWKRTKSRVQASVKNIAKELVDLYAARQQKEGFVYGPDTVWQREFEEMFPFEETEDQLNAIADAKRDMESTKIMDRLICGDVGFGKTEVALRAAFKAVQESRQVVYLVPTTILAQQHYNTFVQRMKEFPVRVDLLCRFRTPAQQKRTLEDLKRGLVDIVIGTHRVLSKDVEFKNLGLLIIDEEQRFGVTHKEKIKQMKKNVDVLTLTATPIPRTLHMSLIGIRDMSVLEEPPMDRVAIQTYVMEYDEETVREAIVRECKRGGQVYYVYNRVNDIAEVASRLSRLVPDVRIDFAHGQMSERQLEKVMYDFINGDTDVLVTTTIIETGLDISNANTMIIHDSDLYGLSQLYQLRGRIGRSNRTAYAFLMYKKDRMLRETAEKRLAAIREFTDLGSGFKIAMRDLEIRGVGNLLGAEQHGQMDAVGYDLYCKMLTEAVKEEKGIQTMEDFETTIDMEMNAYIPDSYIPNEYQKLDIYKRIAAIQNQQEYDEILEELLDRFGEPPKVVMNLLAIASLKAAAHEVYLREIRQKGNEAKLFFYEKAKINTAGLMKLVKKWEWELAYKKDRLGDYLLFTPRKNGRKKLKELLEELKPLVET